MLHTKQQKKNKMKINKALAVGLLAELGFPNSKDWDNDKLVSRLEQVPVKIGEADVSDKFKKIFKDLSTAVASKDALELVDGTAPVAEKTAKPAAKTDKAASKPAAKKEVAKPAAKAVATEKKPVTKASAKPVAKTEKAEKPEKKAKVEVEKDAFGAGRGSVRSSVNLAVGEKWLTHEELAEKAGTKPRQAKVQLRRLLRLFPKQFEKRKRIEYRLIPQDKKA